MYILSNRYDMEEKILRERLKSDSSDVVIQVLLGFTLIYNTGKIEEGLQLIEKQLRLYPQDYYTLEAKGWGLYKLKRYQEAYDILQKAGHLD